MGARRHSRVTHMDNKQELSVNVLRLESERTRAALAGTVTELRERVSDTASEIKTMVSPAHIKEEIRTFVREERESLRHSLERKVRENPLQAAAVAAAISYPAIGLLRAIPMPLVMIGAGVFLTSSRGKKVLADASSKAGAAIDQGIVGASGIGEGLRDTVVQRAEPLARALNEAGEAITERTDDLARGIRRNIHDLRDAASGAADQVSGAVGAVQENITGQVRGATAQASLTIEESKSVLMDWVDRNPLAIAGIGAAVGAFIAAALPSSTAENRALGSVSDSVKDKAREAASDGLKKAKDVASDVVDNVKAAVAREGLDGETLKHSAENLTDGLKAVAERGLKTALSGLNEVSDAPQTPPTQTH